ncbi:NADPH oxidase 5 [Hypsibius exemplaris]|uniref:NADPH oxidase 5 n=1 Tax=Hypsibius exemplaris TaxID=2072580 RepID=A0A9X6NPE5_HYPEX|nr:NADPH oxidase 5 [Hypsibius exemplaris]
MTVSKGESAADVSENISTIFRTWDINGDGMLSREELATSLEEMASKQKFHLSKDKIHAMTDAIFQSVAQELEEGAPPNSTLSQAEWNQLSRKALDRRVSFAVLQLEEKDKSVLGKLLQFLRVYKLQTIWTVLFFTLQVVLFFVRMERYYRELSITKRAFTDLGMVSLCFAQCLQVNIGILLTFPALRWTTGYLRRTWVAKFIPFDSWVSFHIIVGSTSVVVAACHVTLYILNMYRNSFYPFYINSNLTFVRMISVSGLIGTDHLGYTAISGWVQLACLIIIWFFALPPIRTSFLYDVFYWAHKLHYVLWAALIVHTTYFWRYLVFPLSILLLEKAYKYFKVLRWSGETRIIEVNLLPTNVTQLIITRPKSFNYNPGDYVYIKVPCLGVLSWHPFTLSSAPEQKDVIWLHVKASGNWTKELRQHFARHAVLNLDRLQVQLGSNKFTSKYDLELQPIVPTIRHVPNLNVRILLDGPYGASTTALFDTEHAVLIGAGIGVTPFASVLGSVLAQYRQMTNAGKTVPKTDGTTSMAINERKLRLKKLDFIWVSREQENIQWFIDLLVKAVHSQTSGQNELVYGCNYYVTYYSNVS